MASTSDFCILIAEDDAFLRQATARTLRKRGYVVIEAADGAEALWLADHYQSHTIDLLISDLKMPGMAGDELVRQLKLSRPDLPVLMVTGEHANNFPPELTSYVVDILQKPVLSRSLVEHVQALLGI